MNRHFSMSLLIIFILVSAVSRAEDAESLFANGLSSYQKGDYAAASESFSKAAHLQPANPYVLYNLGLVEAKLGKVGKAMGLWRKAAGVLPGFAPAESALKWGQGKLEIREQNSANTLLGDIRGVVLKRLNGLLLSAIIILFFFLTGWSLLKYFGRRRTALLEESELPSFPYLSIVFGFAFLSSSVLLLIKIADQNSVKATIISAKVEVRSAPQITSTTLFELFEGYEVSVRQSMDNWYQVTSASGMTGWVDKENMFISSTWTEK